MKNTPPPFKKEECRNITALFKNAEFFQQCNYFQNLAHLENLIAAFYDEVTHNCLHLNDSHRQFYFNWILVQFKGIAFQDDSSYIDSELKKYREDYFSFPQFKNPELISRLSSNLSKRRFREISEKDYNDHCANNVLQSIFFQYILKQRLEEIKEYLTTTFKDISTQKQLRSMHDSSQPMRAPRKTEKELFRLLKKNSQTIAPQNDRPLTAASLIRELKALEEKVQTLWEDMEDEINDNLHDMNPEKSWLYLMQLTTECTEYSSIFSQKENLLLTPEKIAINDPARFPDKTNREKIIQGLRSFNSKKLLCVTNLAGYCHRKLQPYQKLLRQQPETKGATSSRFNINQKVQLCSQAAIVDLEYYGNNSRTAEFLSDLLDLSHKNIKTAIERLDVPEAELSPKHREDIQIVAKHVEEKGYLK